jgi:hypothetical protein
VIDQDFGSEWGALGFAAKDEEGLSGQHAGDLLVIVDEASGVQERSWNALHGLAASRYVVCGNPIKYDCHFRELNDLAVKGAPGIVTIPISSLEHPHAELEESPIGAVCRSFLRSMEAIHSASSPWYMSNILAQFPGQDSVQFIPTAWLDACTRESILHDELWMSAADGAAVMGVDVAGGVGADRSVIVVRNRKRILEIFASEWHGVLDDARHRLEPEVLRLAAKWQVAPNRVVYDKPGPGRSFASYLSAEADRQIEHFMRTRAIDQPKEWIARHCPKPFSGAYGYFGASKGGKQYINRRTANAYALRRLLDPHRDDHVPFYCGGLPEWPALRQELAELRSPAMEMEEGQVKQVLESKDELMSRLHRSPDILDALLMTFSVSV